MASVGTAFVDVGGNFDGFNQGVENAGKNLLGKADGWGTAIKAAIAPAFAIGAVVGLEQLGAKFDDAFDQIRIGTGATGAALEGLQQDFKDTLSQVPSSFGDTSTAIADLNARLGLTGKPLSDLATQFLNLSRITKTDLGTNVDNITRVFGDWGIATGDQSAAMDKLFRASQSSGIGIQDLSSSIVQFGAPFRNLGFTFDQSAALLAQFNKTGVNTDTVIAGLKAGVGKLAKSGEDVPTTFKRIVEQITALGPGTEATGLAIKLFGQRAGPDLADAIAGGKFSIDDMLKAIDDGSDTINQAASDTDDWREKLDILKNKALVALEPIASSVFDGFTRVTEWLIDTGLPKLGDAFGTVRDTVQDVIGDVIAGFQNPGELFGIGNWNAIFVDIGVIAGRVVDGVVTAFDAVKNWFVANWPAIQSAFETAWEKVQLGFQWLLDHKAVLIGALTAISLVIFGPLTTAIAGFALAYTKWDGFRKVIDNIVKWVQTSLLPALRGFILWVQTNTAKLVDYVSERWESISKAVLNVIKVLTVAVGIALAPLIFVWQHAHDQIMDIVNVVWGTIQLTIGTAIRIIKDIIDVVIGLLSGDWGMAWDAIKDIPQAAFEYMIGTVQLGIDAVKAIIEGALAILAGLWDLAWSGIQTVLSTAWQAIIDVVTTSTQTVVQFFIDLPGRILTALGDLASLLVQKGIDLIIGLLQGLAQKVLDLWAWEASLPGLILGALGSLLSTLMQSGKDLLIGLLTGLALQLLSVILWFTELPGKILSAIGNLANTLYQKGRDLVQGFIDGIKSKAGDVLVAIGNAVPGGLGSSGTKGAVTPVNPDGTPKTASGGVFTHQQVRSIAEQGAEGVFTGDQALNILWTLGQGGAANVAGPQAATLPPIHLELNGVAADPQTLTRMASDELSWMLRTRAA